MILLYRAYRNKDSHSRVSSLQKVCLMICWRIYPRWRINPLTISPISDDILIHSPLKSPISNDIPLHSPVKNAKMLNDTSIHTPVKSPFSAYISICPLLNSLFPSGIFQKKTVKAITWCSCRTVIWWKSFLIDVLLVEASRYVRYEWA
jgi:hypothetical protein